MILFIFIFGLIIGSFLNSAIYRLRHGGRIHKERSRCPHCHKTLGWFELIPLLSFIIQRGRCRSCKKRISWQYPLVELVTGVLFVVTFLVHSPITSYGLLASLELWQSGPVTSYLLVRDWVYICFLVIIFVYDLRWQLILDKVTIPGVILALIINLALAWQTGVPLAQVLGNLLLAAAVVAGFFLLQFVVSKGHWIGGGDIRLGALMGVMLGWPNALWALMLAYLIGAVVAIGLIISRDKTWSSQVPFGTFLSLATILILLWNDQIINWYLGLFRFL